MKKSLLALALLSLVNTAQADTVSPEHTISALVGGWSQHWNDPYRDRYNENNEVKGLIFDDKLIILKMKNSYWHDSVLVAYNFKLAGYEYNDFTISAGISAGLVHGYRKGEIKIGYLAHDISLYIVPNIQFKYQLTDRFNVGVDLGFLGTRYGLGTTQTVNFTYSF